MNKSSYLKKKIKKEIFKKGLGTRGIGLVLLRLLPKKNHQSKFSIPWKNSRFPNFSKKKKKRERKKKKKKKISKLSIPLKNSSFPKKKNLHQILLQEQKAMILFYNFQWCNIKSIVHPQHSLKHGVCPKLGAFARYAEFFSMNNSVTNWKYLFCRY